MVDIPDDICDAIGAAVTNCLAAELGERGLLLPADRWAAAEAEVAADADGLLTSVIHSCYPLSEYDTQVVSVEFDSEAELSRVRSALAFGAATAGLLVAPHRSERRAAIGLLSAIFNLGIGLIDGVCDDDRGQGLRLLDLIDGGDVARTAREPRPRGWLRVQLPADLEAVSSVSFAADIVETFFAALHATFPGAPWWDLRAHVGDQLAAALEAERSSLVSSVTGAPRQQLIQYSYATSVLPFEIVGTLVGGDHASSAARFLGEAMWRIDDLVDLCDDTRTGALNAVLLAASSTGSAALEEILRSDAIREAAAHATDSLRRGVDMASGRRHADVFLQFIARYAGIGPVDRS